MRPRTSSFAVESTNASSGGARRCGVWLYQQATVRTIVGKKAGTDRTSSRNLKRIEIDRLKAAAWKRTVRTIDDMPRRTNQVVKNRRALLTEAKGLGRA